MVILYYHVYSWYSGILNKYIYTYIHMYISYITPLLYICIDTYVYRYICLYVRISIYILKSIYNISTYVYMCVFICLNIESCRKPMPWICLIGLSISCHLSGLVFHSLNFADCTIIVLLECCFEILVLFSLNLVEPKDPEAQSN